jgi:hypothetical protein
MKKQIIFCCIYCLFTAATFAQSFAFYQGGKKLDNNAEFTVSTTSLDEFDALVLESGLSLKNLTAYSIGATCTQRVLIAPPDEESGILNFCFENCVAGNQPIKSQSRAIAGNELMTPPVFHLCLYPVEGIYVQAKVLYEIYPTGNSSDKTTVTVTYNYNSSSAGLLNNIALNNKLIIFQEGKNLKFNYSSGSNIQLEIYNITGEKSAAHNLNPTGLFSLPEELAKGFYVCIIKNEDGILACQKFVVR